ncbi:MAG: hypothetical protein COT71_01840 [Candidatus Andersenbacteria bacterium CG10_big_fil_rev_8_21_14_0_10_54_11]|uniref:Uncharacterized protein n=1 Tax=Candidatus Andersenbacteria bacterium CG10_big_fil_rev_8_21_14_0_10_54_11 TaxID=1974485 RepID=A0A2M6WZI5_9BACT|nr:MAG: hypothetical protein COT71_01840 [Candidatus Andersenbacteria bacterium CG10_big_fil_rev_8_21_14_0_10_54_11]
MSRSNWEVWKSIEIGGTSKKRLKNWLTERGMRCNDPALHMMTDNAFTVVRKERQVDLVAVAGYDLGFDQSAPQGIIWQRAREYGLKLCPPEIGPQLRGQYAEQPADEHLGIAMESFVDSNGIHRIFNVAHYNGILWLCTFDGYGATPNCPRDPDFKFIFLT